MMRMGGAMERRPSGTASNRGFAVPKPRLPSASVRPPPALTPLAPLMSYELGRSDHPREQQAEQMAETLSDVSLRAPRQPLSTHTAADSADRLSHLDGQPLGDGLRAYFESSLGTDLRHVRVHADERASRLAQCIEAEAFTVGRHIVFDQGRYQPGTRSGRRLPPHQLT